MLFRSGVCCAHNFGLVRDDLCEVGWPVAHRAWVSHVRSVTVALGVAGALERPGEAHFASRVLGDLDAFMSFQERAEMPD